MCTLRYVQVLARDMGVSCFVYMIRRKSNVDNPESFFVYLY